MEHLPIFLRLRDRPVTVIGGGLIATRKVELLLRCEAHVTVVAPQLHRELRELLALAARRFLRHVASPFEARHLDGAALVIAATDSPETNAAVAAEARARALPVNVVDDPVLSTFILPAIIDRAPVVVAVGTGGSSPVLARRLRAQIESLLPARLGGLARFLGRHREAVRNRVPPARRRAFWERVLDGSIATRVLAGDDEGAARSLAESLERSAEAEGGEVYLIGAGPGDPDLLTLRALQLLQRADVILHDRLVPAAVLDRARRDAVRVSVGKTVGDREMTQERINELLVGYAKAGQRVARLKGGDPFVFGRGGEELQALRQAGIAFTVVPGITAALGAAATAAIPLTHRRVAHAVTFVTGHLADGDALDWPALARPGHTVVFYMSVAHLEHIVSRLIASGAPAERPVAFVERASQPEERIVRSTLAHAVSDARQARIQAPALLIVGDVAAADFLGSIPAAVLEPLRGVA
ncbi:MAG TPA: siroheme synthase CysG [Steroidobacteraceae bacterium]|nr:siroheme synthase CysG [Steroidobacteraceae bacterium]